MATPKNPYEIVSLNPYEVISINPYRFYNYFTQSGIDEAEQKANLLASYASSPKTSGLVPQYNSSGTLIGYYNNNTGQFTRVSTTAPTPTSTVNTPIYDSYGNTVGTKTAPAPITPTTPTAPIASTAPTTSNNYESYIRGLIIQKRQANPSMPYYDVWGKVSDQLKAEGINPTDYDQVFWELLHPEGLAGYEKYVGEVNTGAINTGDPVLNEALVALQTTLNTLIQQGKTINSAVEITPEKAAEFLAQASREIDPYYTSSLKIARDYLLRSEGYTKEDIKLFEQDIEKKYGKALTNIAETKAEQGLALSGGRIREERELAEETQQTVNENRRQLAFQATNQASEFAQNWGTQNITPTTIGEAPKVRAGEKMFQKGEGVSNLYTLNPEVYSNLTGYKQYEQETAKRLRTAELEEAFRQIDANKKRSLNL